ncbi:MAG: hypothetical protein LBE13_07975, partial [Bacteroidales bacterium]|nr:hypothetical protein [Bacteroidales bacterium]
MTLVENCIGDERAGEYKLKIGMKDSKPIDNNSKVIYIPAERNFVSAIYNLQEYLRDRDNIQDFVIN